MKGWVKKLAIILGILSSLVVISGAVKTLAENNNTEEATPATAAVCVINE